ncbi:MAG: hypothetical protein IPJ89_00610 [Candidatus Iainarchaeum archaeon]|uniref:Prefoldin subunit alpha n=1 Tax=Candidatus Iainarchaeum sp. TaxID=3101447 RepID=A0A7T9DK52_9ARCH|nr:MAG: hypothetical protein IPJ89_00610 [Candidatus Diapherotrites archaeon]
MAKETNPTPATQTEAAPRSMKATMTMDQVRQGFLNARRSIKRIRQQQNAILAMLQENAIVGNALKYLDEKNETEAIIPLGAGISMKGKVRGKELLRTLPGNVVVPASKKEIEEDLAERKKVFEKEMEVLQKQLHQAREYAKNMQSLGKAFRDARKATKR